MKIERDAEGYVICPECGKPNQYISKASEDLHLYARHPKCSPAYKAAQHAKFKRLRERVSCVATVLAVVLMQYQSTNPPIYLPPVYPVPPPPPIYMNPVPAVPSLPPTYPPYHVPPVRR